MDEKTIIAIVNFDEAEQALGNKYQWCGCYDGVHKSDCKFILSLP